MLSSWGRFVLYDGRRVVTRSTDVLVSAILDAPQVAFDGGGETAGVLATDETLGAEVDMTELRQKESKKRHECARRPLHITADTGLSLQSTFALNQKAQIREM